MLYVFFLKTFFSPLHPTVGSTKARSTPPILGGGFQGNELFIGGWLHCRLAHYWVFTDCSLHFTGSQAAKNATFFADVEGWCVLLVHKQNGNSQIQVSWSNSYCKKHSCRRSFYLFVWCELVDSFFFQRPCKSTWSTTKIQAQNEEPQMSLPILYDRWRWMKSWSIPISQSNTWTYAPWPGLLIFASTTSQVDIDGKWCWTRHVGEDFDKMHGWFSSVHPWHLKNQGARNLANLWTDGELEVHQIHISITSIFKRGMGFLYLKSSTRILESPQTSFEAQVLRCFSHFHFSFHLNPCRLRNPASRGQLQCKLWATLHRYGEPRGWKRHILVVR